MSESKITHTNRIHSVINEVMGAMTSLNMYPEPLDNPQGDYLADQDKWANHAKQHLEVAIELLFKALNNSP